MNKTAKYVIFGIACVAEITGLVWMRGEYKSTLAEGVVYETPVTIDEKKNSGEAGYLILDNAISEAAWAGDGIPAVGEAVHVAIDKDKKKGTLAVLYAQADEPAGDHITVRVAEADENTVRFRWPNNRLYVAGAEKKKQMVDELTFRVPLRDYLTDKVVSNLEKELVATVRVKDGKVAYEDIKVKGKEPPKEEEET